ncbi:putative ER lumen protein-retaining receptor C28H8.4 [Chenopodium quinoa]|uniref:putative ER lumen protein-retaining receptor C28H8.4 n=1 Tax=Chenopodium quinoa TaxID=63459 RepID=UPI000B799D1C|nr:putative ER lumen protein-retaining receptor C28H8.4 [Chenopodium quinoa]
MGDKNATPVAVKRIGRWVRSPSVREQVTMGVVAAFVLLVLIKVFVKSQTYLFVATQVAHSAGILLLIYKLTITKTCSGLSLKTQELTAMFLLMRILCFFGLFRDIHVVLDSLTLVCTLWVIYMMRYKVKNTYMQELDSMPLYYVLVPCAIVAIIGHPGLRAGIILGFFFMYYITIEAVSVLPQLQLLQKAKMIEPFTAHYVFALGVARFFSCANWINMLIGSRGELLTKIGQAQLYILVALIAEVVQTFILADFCYYYVKSVMAGERMMRLPSLV